MLPIFVLLLTFSSSFADEPSPHHQLPSDSIARDPNTIFVLFGTRHGNRNPEKFFEQNEKTWGFEGSSELTKFGKLQAYGLGKSIRALVGDLVSKNYMPKETKAFSSSANRCQMTLQTALAGIFPPQSFADWNDGLDWSPIPYTIDDNMLRMYNQKCPSSDKAWAPISEDNLPELVELTEKQKQLLVYIQQHTGWNASISNAAEAADNLIEIDLYKAPYPDWIANPTLEGYDAERMKKEILAFAENHQIKCAEYKPCRDMMAGVWLKNIVDFLKEKAKNSTNGPKLVAYASHTEITLSLMKLLFIDKDEVTTSAGFVIEYRESPNSAVRLLNHDPNPIAEHVIYQATYMEPLKAICSDDNWCPLTAFIDLVDDNEITDYKTACGIDECDGATKMTPTTDTNNIAKKTGKLAENCATATDDLGYQCPIWAKYGYCENHKPTKYLHCRKTCLCDRASATA